MKSFVPILKIIVFLILSFTYTIFANGNIKGTVKDSKLDEPLYGANIILVGTALGAATDLYGKFELRNIPPGTYILKVSYIGYEEKLQAVDIVDDRVLNIDFMLEAVTIEGEEVLVTAQASGQNAAINQQISSNQIKNVVSSARIQEVPDANAAESVGRLPGVSIQRSGGEGNQVVVRGLEPKYNAILVNGVRLSSTNPNDRSVDISMISPYMLDGIEVSKNVLPDQDADVLGGTINFKIKTAGGNQEKEGFGYNFLAQNSYTGLANARNAYNNYKYVGSIEGRFFESKLGAFLQGDYERKNLSSNQMDFNVTNFNSDDRTKYAVNSLSLYNIPRDRKRLNVTLALDYKVPDGRIYLTNMYSSGETKTLQRNEIYNIIANTHSHIMQKSTPETNILTNSFSYEQRIGEFDFDLGLSHTYSQTKDPNNWILTFLERNTFSDIGQFRNVANLDPRVIPGEAANNFTNTVLEFARNNSNNYLDRSYTGNLDVKTRLDFSNMINAEIKVGGKFRSQNRSNNSDVFNGAGISLASASGLRAYIEENFNTLSINGYLDPNYDLGEFLNGEYDLTSALNEGTLTQLSDMLYNNQQEIANRNSSIAYAKNQYLSKTNDYSGKESYYAYYGMATIEIGERIDLITGFRIQNLKTEYTGSQGIQRVQQELPYNHYDTTVTKTQNHFLPSVIVKYQPFNWFDVRFAYTNTLSYPDFQAIIPRIDESTLNGQIFYNDPHLKASESRNLDLYLSLYDNNIGLFTVGVFHKKIKNQIYPYNFFINKSEAQKYYPPGLYNPNVPPAIGYNIFTYINNKNDADLWGIELDWQTHFWYLPFPFNGLVLNTNYTHTKSETIYPIYVRVKNFPPTYEEQTFEDRLLSQPNDLFNISLGYDYKDFSIRASLLYQDDIFSNVNFWPQLRATTDSYTRIDISIKQELPWYNVQLFALLNNITNEKDSDILQLYNDIPLSQETYGMSGTLGLRIAL